MNMGNAPTADQLAELLASVDDSEGHHILWVSKTGEVKITKVPNNLSPGGWSGQESAVFQFRFEAYQAGNGYVGAGAAADPKYVDKVLHQLIDHWDQGSTGLIDY